MEKTTNCGKLVRNVFIILIVLALPGALFAQQFRVEGTAGFNIFSLSDPELESEASGDIDATVTSDLSYDAMLHFGVYGGMDLGSMEVGAEFQLASGGGETSDITASGLGTLPDSAGSYDFSFFKVGPVVRYYFGSANPEVVPYAGAAVDYVSATVDINDPSLKISQSYLDIGVFGGANYWLEENFYIGGMARIDYYACIGDDSISGVDIEGDTVNFEKITTDGWMPLSIFFTVGTTF